MALLFLCIFAVGIFFVGVLQGTFSDSMSHKVEAVGGLLDLQGYDFSEEHPINLNGQWEYYPSIFCTAESFDYELFNNVEPDTVTFPIDYIPNSSGPSTYRLLINAEIAFTGFSFYIPNYNEDFAVYVNGNRVPPIQDKKQGKLLDDISEYLFNIDRSLEPGITEIIISANSNDRQALMYRNSIVFGSSEKVSNYVLRLWRDDAFLIGTIIVLACVGLIFMLLNTKMGLLSGIALFDTFLAIRVILGFDIATHFLNQLLYYLEIGNIGFVTLQYVSFFVVASVGCLLSQSIYDPDKKLPELPIKIQILASFAGGIFTLFFFPVIPDVCINIVLILFICSFTIVSWQVYHEIKAGLFSIYHIFITIKTFYVGILIIVDALFAQNLSYSILAYSYVVFLFAHLFSRLVDSNASYKEKENLNQNLEKIVEIRTRELTEANALLSELSIKDALTQSYNRLYFEKFMEKILINYSGQEFYLCIFDLDFFKNINDNYGHDVGDEQLKSVVRIVKAELDENATLSRVGGEEFAIIFLGMPYEKVYNSLESIRKKLQDEAENNSEKTTASFGLAKYRPELNQKEFLKLADKCLYIAKEQGRNRIVSEIC